MQRLKFFSASKVTNLFAHKNARRQAAVMPPKPAMSDDACRVCGKEDDEEFLVLCDGCDRPFHTACHVGCVCCNLKPRNNFSRKPAVPEGDWFSRIHTGGNFAMAQTTEGHVYTWGYGELGQLGHQENKNKKAPKKISALRELELPVDLDIEEPAEFLLGRDITILAAGKSHAAAVVTGTLGLWTWGFGEQGQIGHPKPAPPAGQSKFFRSQFRIPRPRLVQALKNELVGQVACGGQHTLVLLRDGRLFAMGDNEYGQLGAKRGETTEENAVDVPVQISAFGTDKKLKQIGCGDDFSVGVTTTGDVYSWGRGQFGQLGLGESQPGPLETPTKLPNLPPIQKVAVGPNQVFAIEFTNGK
ncbi:hypothetical protein BBJ28_00014102 [Nothophytophthora sp. Chile5]|nr:hypothetical protein BBJ28_00014102 [Nothophytophthora sp. Chile5]